VTAGRIKKVLFQWQERKERSKKEEMWRSGAEGIDEVCAQQED
jgi:hypothetical protein